MENTLHHNPSTRKKIIYIAGSSRSGSTLFSALLNKLEDTITVGEIKYFWERGIRHNWKCNCGEYFLECPFWTKVLSNMYPDESNVPEVADSIFSINESSRENNKKKIRYRHLFFYSKEEVQKKIEEDYLSHLSSLYNSVAEVSGNSTIVDASKSVEYLLCLDKIPSFELHIIHLIRDVRGVVYSENFKIKKMLGTDDQDKVFVRNKKFKGLLESVLFWWLNNYLITKYFGKNRNYTRIHYEDFIRDPGKVINNIQKNIYDKIDYEIDTTNIEYNTFHSFSGNPDRVSSNTKLQNRDEWKEKLNVFYRIVLSPMKFLFR